MPDVPLSDLDLAVKDSEQQSQPGGNLAEKVRREPKAGKTPQGERTLPDWV
jgi:hypothetical protein